MNLASGGLDNAVDDYNMASGSPCNTLGVRFNDRAWLVALPG